MIRIITMIIAFATFSFATYVEPTLAVDEKSDIKSLLKEIELNDSFMDQGYKDLIEDRNHFSQEQFVHIYAQATPYIPVIQEIFDRYGIPRIFMYMPVIESNFKEGVRSRAGAVGIWQLVPVTARAFGLKVSKKVDERNDVVKSTVAVARYLNAMHAKLGKWYLVIMAYSCGDGALKKAIIKAQSRQAEVLLDERKKYVSAETRNHFKKLVTVYTMGGKASVQAALSRKKDQLSSLPHFVSKSAKTQMRLQASMDKIDQNGVKRTIDLTKVLAEHRKLDTSSPKI